MNITRKPATTLLIAAAAFAAPVQAQSDADTTAIRAAALDYIEGWYAGDGARMERALHPEELAKRIVITDPRSGASRLESMSAMALVAATRSGAGSRTPEARRQKDVTVLDIFQNAAVARIVAADWIDYLQLAKSNGRWVIVNVLWEIKRPPAP